MWSRLNSIAQEQARALVQGSFSTVVGEMEDIASGLYDSRGDMFAQGVTGTQGILVGMSNGIKHFLAKYPPQSLEPGDVLICNDPWMFTGHKFDIVTAMPVFLGERFVGLTGAVSHATDIGGIRSSGDSEGVFDEGLQIPILKYFRGGKPNPEVHEMIRANVRMPAMVMGDIMAQVSACEVGARKLLAFMREYGLDSLDELSQAITDRTEQAVKEAIRAMPDGEWSHTVQLDGIDEPLHITAKMSVRGDDMHVDFAGTSPQTRRGGINGAKNFTDAFVYHPIKTVLAPEAPNNAGLFRSVTVTAPPGSLVNATFPAPVMSRFMIASFVAGAVNGCLAQALPGTVIAESGGTQMQLLSGYRDSGAPFVYWLLGLGGMGARPGLDGYHATNFPGNLGNVPVEIIENVMPLHVRAKRLITDSGGAGQWRGGCDQEITLSITSDYPATIHSFFEHTTVGTLGYHGGHKGSKAIARVNGRDIHPKRKYPLMPGDELTFSSAAGGGLFAPAERAPEAVLEDVLEGYVSVEAARRDYRVAIDLAARAVDIEETAKLRNGRG